jgi:pilus assembly protein CpaB
MPPSSSLKTPQSKRKLVQLGIAVAVALVCAVGSIAVIIGLLGSVNTNQAKVKKEADKQVKQLQAQLEAFKAQTAPSATQQTVSQVQVLTAIAPSQPITREQLALVDVSKADDLPGGLHTLADVVGKVANSALAPGTVLTQSMVSSPSSVATMPTGYRAVTISLDPVGGIGGNIMPGSYVDVMVTATASGVSAGGASPTTKTVLQRVRIMDVQRPGGAAAGDKPNPVASLSGNVMVTLAVKPNQAEVLALAQQMGKFHLSLRGFEDNSVAQLPGSRWQQLVSVAGARSAAKTKAYNAPPVAPLPSFDELMRYQNPTSAVSLAGSMAPNGTALPTTPPPSVKPVPYQMELVKGSNSEWVSLQKN